MLRWQARTRRDVEETEEVVRVGPNRPLFAVMAAVSLGVAAVPLTPVLLSASWHDALWALLLGGSLPVALLYGSCARFCLLLALRPGGAAVTLDAEGVRDRTRQFGAVDVIRWEEIASVSLSGSGPLRVLRIRVRDLDALRARQRPVTRYVLGVGWPVGGTPLSIAQMGIDVPLEWLKEQIEARLSRHENERRWWTQR